MLSPKQNFLETIKLDGKPDLLVRQYEGTAFLPGDPVANYVRGQRHPGVEAKKDKWGTMIVWPVGSPGPMPKVTQETKVIRDVRRWRDFTKVPDLVANCSDQALWVKYLERVANVDRENSTEDQIRMHVRDVCERFGPGGHFIPCITYGAPGTIYPAGDRYINDEIDLYNREKYD